MEPRSNFDAAKVHRMSEVFPHAAIADKFIFLSGTADLNPKTGIIVSENFEDQTRQCFLNIKTILELCRDFSGYTTCPKHSPR